MPARKKPHHLKITATIPVRVSPALKADADAMAEETGISTSDRVRACLEKAVAEWKRTRTPSK